MEIVIENVRFGYDVGCRLLKLKYDKCPFPSIEDIWGDIKPMSFKEIGKLENIEERRVGMLCLGIDRLVKEANPKLVDRQTISKETSYVNNKGEYVKMKFDDTYELYEVDAKNLWQEDRWNNGGVKYCFVKFKDTSTEREYMIWVDPSSVSRTNDLSHDKKINATQAIAWTMQTNVEEGNIKEVLRQGDCILVKPKDASKPLLESPRHLTEKEYLKYLVAES